ncbi:ImmA/IrrE family metallo-endopeptidase [Thermosyntropha sp.]|uniref:ImmA/IrrE family metallo-endopeptidase n=1 Tax=Thermosyntropha sp. TaxID=2740820 RepID=UPI0025EE3A0A|nr:ImmA/IrrE family metallo-endopeptidase [Thermosyntropha sp.]MBO8158859.1 ImmA/IrrE family metallo-endopeptidase [Thermosyntropha sp.]
MIGYIKPRFKRTAQIAAQTLISHGVNQLPVNEKMFIKQHDNWELMTYTEFGKINNLNEEEVIFIIGSFDGCAFYDADNNRYLIIYNDNPLWIENPQRIRWTIMHEIGHILLGHLEETQEAMITRAALGNQKYKIFEIEAEYFAANILAPAPVLFKLNLFSVEEIMKICNISKTAAENRLKHLLKRMKKGKLFDDDFDIYNQFLSFIYKKRCLSCHYTFSAQEANYCPICGGKFLEWFGYNNTDKWGGNNLIYNDGYELDENSRAIVCPRCGNEELNYEGNYCNICGAYLINRCSDEIGYDINGNPIIVEEGCGTLAAGNARYCIKCGRPTTFFVDKLLLPWNKAKAKIETENEIEAATTLEDIPF